VPWQSAKDNTASETDGLKLTVAFLARPQRRHQTHHHEVKEQKHNTSCVLRIGGRIWPRPAVVLIRSAATGITLFVPTLYQRLRLLIIVIVLRMLFYVVCSAVVPLARFQTETFRSFAATNLVCVRCVCCVTMLLLSRVLAAAPCQTASIHQVWCLGNPSLARGSESPSYLQIRHDALFAPRRSNRLHLSTWHLLKFKESTRLFVSFSEEAIVAIVTRWQIEATCLF